MHPCPFCGAALERLTPFCPHCAGALDVVAATATFGPSERPLRRATSTSAGRPTAGEQFEAGTFFGDRYRIVGLLGRGGMGEVYRADDLKLGQPVALKLLPRGFEHGAGRLDRFLAEIRTARQVSHPNVCRVYDVGEIDGRHFLSMEYIDGEDLSALLRRIGRLPHDKAIEIARQICAGLAASHERGVIHRDLKPANVMLDGRGKVRITDFGLAAVAGAELGGEIAGTPAYMAPEQLAGGPLSPQTDIYALGLLLFELFTGRRVHDVTTIEDLRRRHATPASNVLSSGSGDVDPAVLRVIERCVEPDPARRPQHAIAVAAALPGGDPLAAALAAGETPSPQMVAAAGEDTLWTAATATRWALAIVSAGILAVALNGRQVYQRFVPLPHSPEVLSAKAGEFLARIGHPAGSDRAGGFRMRPQFLSWAEANHPGMDPRPALSRLPMPMVTYWRYDSPFPIVSDFIGTIGDGASRFGIRGAVPRIGPPVMGGAAGETLVEVTPDGRLVRYQAEPAATRTAVPGTHEPDWADIFSWAGLDFAQFSETTSTFAHEVPVDVRRSWVRPPTGDWATDGLRVEAGASEGRLAYFELVMPWSVPDRTLRPTYAPVVMLGVLGTLLGVIMVAGAVLAFRNVRMGRGDRRGAARLAWFVGVCALVASIGGMHHVLGISTISGLGGAIGYSMYVAGVVYVFYMALEPFVRRRWPHALIGWSRLLAGGWRDPVVGRELAIGTTAGLVFAALTFLGPVLASRAGVWIPPGDLVTSMKWLGISTAAPALYSVASVAGATPFLALFGLFVLLLLRVTLRHEWLAAAAAVLMILGTGVGAMTHPAIQGPLYLAGLVLGVVVLMRQGFLAYVALNVPILFIGLLGLSFGGDVFYHGSIIAGLLLLIAPGLFGVYTALGGRPVFGTMLEE